MGKLQPEGARVEYGKAVAVQYPLVLVALVVGAFIPTAAALLALREHRAKVMQVETRLLSARAEALGAGVVAEEALRLWEPMADL